MGSSGPGVASRLAEDPRRAAVAGAAATGALALVAYMLDGPRAAAVSTALLGLAACTPAAFSPRAHLGSWAPWWAAGVATVASIASVGVASEYLIVTLPCLAACWALVTRASGVPQIAAASAGALLLEGVAVLDVLDADPRATVLTVVVLAAATLAMGARADASDDSLRRLIGGPLAASGAVALAVLVGVTWISSVVLAFGWSAPEPGWSRVAALALGAYLVAWAAIRREGPQAVAAWALTCFVMWHGLAARSGERVLWVLPAAATALLFALVVRRAERNAS